MKPLFFAVGLVLFTVSVHTQTPSPPLPRRTVPRPAAVRVIVRDQSGTPIADVRVAVSGAASRDAVTDPNGIVTFASMRDGTYRLRFERTGFVTLERDVALRNGQPREVEVALTAVPEPPAAPPPEPEPPAPAPPPPAASAPAVTLSIPAFLDKNFIGRDPLKESVLGCTNAATTRLLQLRDPLAEHTHPELDEILYVVAGEGTVRIRDEVKGVSAGSLSVIPRGLPHAIERRGRNPLIVLSVLAGTPCQGASTTQEASKR